MDIISCKIPREHVEKAVSVVLRVPSLFIVEAWFRTDPLKAVDVKTKDLEIIVTCASYLGLVLAVTLATLPLKKLVTFYMYLVSVLLLLGAHLLSSLYVTSEQRGMEEVTPISVFDDHAALQKLMFHLAAQCFIAALVTYLIDMKTWTKYGMLVYTAPMLARLSGLHTLDLPAIHSFCSAFTLLMCMFYMFNKFGYMLDFAKDGLIQAMVAVRAFGWLPVIVAFWHMIMLPAQLLIFWLVLFGTQLYVYFYSENHPVMQEGWVILLLASMGECCATPVSLFALCVTISYLSYFILTLTKMYLQGWDAVLNDNDLMRGWTEGFTMLLIAVQTGLLDLRPLQRAFLMSILLFIVASSLIQSMYDIMDPALLTLSASHNRSIVKHLKAVSLCMFLWVFPLYMTYAICQYFDLDFWLLVIISSCLLTSVQVMGSLVVYALFMYDTTREESWELLDDVVYYARSATRVLEFMIAVFVVCYGIRESLFGEWSWINSSILIIHCYFNVWQRLQTGWKSFLLRREAVKMVSSLPDASEEQLQELNDVCAICYQEMTKSAKVTPCGHYFHGFCLRKWLYVKDACPMCHQKLSFTAPSPEGGMPPDNGGVPPDNAGVPPDNGEGPEPPEKVVPANSGVPVENGDDIIALPDRHSVLHAGELETGSVQFRQVDLSCEVQWLPQSKRTDSSDHHTHCHVSDHAAESPVIVVAKHGKRYSSYQEDQASQNVHPGEAACHCQDSDDMVKGLDFVNVCHHHKCELSGTPPDESSTSSSELPVLPNHLGVRIEPPR